MVFFFKQKTAYEIGTGDWSSDVCSSDLVDQRSAGSGAGSGRCGAAVLLLSGRVGIDGKTHGLVRAIEIGRASCRERV